jgi:hypothetical protein
MVWPLTWIVIVGTLPGVFIGTKMVRDLMKKTIGTSSQANSEKRFQEMVKSRGSRTTGTATITHFNLRRLGFSFYDESFDVSLWAMWEGFTASAEALSLPRFIHIFPWLRTGCWPEL